MKLLLAHNFYREEGGENGVYRAIVSLLRERGHQVVEYTRDSRELDALGAAGKAVAIPAGFHSPRTAREVAELVAREKPEAALVQNVFPLISPALYRTLRRAGVPTAQLVYNYRFLCPDGHLYTQGAICERCVTGTPFHAVRFACYRDSRVFSAWYAGIVAAHRSLGTFREIDWFGVPDRFLQGKLAEGGLGVGRSTVLGNPFQLPPPPLSPREEGGAVLFVGRLIPQKGLLTLIRALARCRSKLALRVVGDGPARAQAEACARELLGDRATFLGAVFGDAVREEMARALVLAIPSEWYDNAPLVLYQAFASATPVIASRIDGLPEVIEDGVTGLLAEPGDVADWARALDRAATDSSLRRALGAAARRQAERELSADAFHSRLGELLRNLTRRS